MLSCLLLLIACSPKVLIKNKDVPVFMPDSLLISPCDAISAGKTLRTLTKGYVINTSCVYEYEALLQSQRDWKELNKLIYEPIAK